ncbi:MAG: hypothetical protein ACRD4A_13455, partial [Candidatus Acidiferrales bacterium]
MDRIARAERGIRVAALFVRRAPLSDLAATARPTRKILGLEWPRPMTSAERNSLLAGGFGWMLDALD